MEGKPPGLRTPLLRWWTDRCRPQATAMVWFLFFRGVMRVWVPVGWWPGWWMLMLMAGAGG